MLFSSSMRTAVGMSSVAWPLPYLAIAARTRNSRNSYLRLQQFVWLCCVQVAVQVAAQYSQRLTAAAAQCHAPACPTLTVSPGHLLPQL